MPAIVWRHGTHAFLELLRRQEQTPLEHTLSFVYQAYSTIASGIETTPEFLETWIERLGDLA